MKNLNHKKALQDKAIPTRILRENSDLFAQFVLKNYNEVITTSTFPHILKHGTARPIYKKDSRNEVQIYRPVNILSKLSKVYEKWPFNEMATQFGLNLDINVDSEKDLGNSACWKMEKKN